jgi:hypothetical protein
MLGEFPVRDLEASEQLRGGGHDSAIFCKGRFLLRRNDDFCLFVLCSLFFTCPCPHVSIGVSSRFPHSLKEAS